MVEIFHIYHKHFNKKSNLIEISIYPLNADYIPPIQDFIHRLNLNKNITVKTNATSTHIVGEYDEVMDILQKEIKSSFP